MTINPSPAPGRPSTIHYLLSTIFPASLLFLLLLLTNVSYSQGRKNDERALNNLLQGPALKTAHVGVLVYDDSLKRDIAAFQDEKYFVPASNTKLFSLYAGLKYLGDSLVGIRYEENDTAVFVFPAGDPSLLHPDFLEQPVVDFLKKTTKKIYIVDSAWQEEPNGRGWGWDDYNDDYAVERSLLPVYGNFIRWTQEKAAQGNPGFEATPQVFSSPEISWKVKFSPDTLEKSFFVHRTIDSNVFEIRTGNEAHAEQDVPFVTNIISSALELLKDTLGKPVYAIHQPPYFSSPASIIYSRPADSVYIPMMHRSDNFFAEQTLLMVSNQKLGLMNDRRIIDTLLKNDLADLPQEPSWVDGSGLSRFNLFSPRDFVTLLGKFKNEFGMDRMKKILPTGGKPGTLRHYYLSDSGFIFAKTGSLNGVIALSGYLYTRKNRLLEFSVLVNNHYSSGTAVRKAVEAYVEYIRKNY